MSISQYEPEKTSIHKFFKSSELFEIPRYQRSFAWKDQQIDEFYTDFVQTSEDNLDFLGTIVLDSSENNKIYKIIDGQQRILAITILVAAIRDILNFDIDTKEAHKIANSIQGSYMVLDPLSLGNETFRLKPSLDLEDFFADFIQNDDLDAHQAARKTVERARKDVAKRNVINAYDLFKRRLVKDKVGGQNAENAISLLGRIIVRFDNINFIAIKVFNNDMAYSIFESHNAKGVDLAVSDLIKNYFFGKLGGTDESKEKFMKRWDDIVSQVQDSANSTIDRFLHYYIQSFQGRFPKSQLYRRIKKIIDTDPQKFIKDLEQNTDIYVQLKSASTSGNFASKINSSLEALGLFNVEQCYILLLSIFRNQDKFTPKMLYKHVRIIENFTYVYSKIMQLQANEMEKEYSLFATYVEDNEEKDRDVFSGKSFQLLQKDLSKLLPDKNQFVINFTKLTYEKSSNKRLIVYTFRRIEEYENCEAYVFGTDIHLDHIFPQNPKDKTIQKPKNLHTIGNLIALDNIRGTRAGNMMPSEKISIYNDPEMIKSSLIKSLVSDLEAANLVVNSEFIESRANSIAAKAYDEVWSLEVIK